MDFKTVADDLKIIRSTLATNLTARNITVDANDGPTTLAKKVALLNSTDTTIDSTDIYNGSTDILSNRTTFRDYLATQLTNKGITVNADDGPLTLAEKVNSILLTTNIVLETNKTELNTATDPTATLKATVTDVRGNPVKGVTVEFFSNNTSLSQSITNSNGVASYDYVGSVSGTYSLTASLSAVGVYNSSVSNNINMIVINYIFIDDGSSNKASSYAIINDCTATTTYQSQTNGYLVTPCYYGSLLSPVPVASLPTDNFELSVKIKKTSSSKGYHGIGVLNSSTNQLLLQGFLWTEPPSLFIEGNLVSGTVQTGVTTNLNTWYTFKLRVQNNSLTLYLLNENASTTLWSKNYGTFTFDRYGVWIRENSAYFKDYQLKTL